MGADRGDFLRRLSGEVSARNRIVLRKSKQAAAEHTQNVVVVLGQTKAALHIANACRDVHVVARLRGDVGPSTEMVLDVPRQDALLLIPVAGHVVLSTIATAGHA